MPSAIAYLKLTSNLGVVHINMTLLRRKTEYIGISSNEINNYLIIVFIIFILALIFEHIGQAIINPLLFNLVGLCLT